MSQSYAVLEALACGRAGCACMASVRRGRGLTHCPAHDDGKPSLNVTWDGAKLLWRCHGGCRQDDVLAALRDRGLLHEIRDQAGQLIARHERKGRWFLPDGTAGLSGATTTAMLYGAELLAGAAPRRGAIVEGERAANALRPMLDGQAVVLATVCGAAATPTDEALSVLRHWRVWLWADHDQPGRQHMDRIAAALSRIGVAEVLMITWPDAPPAGDAADFVEGHDYPALLALLHAAAPWEPDSPEHAARSGGHGDYRRRRLLSIPTAEALQEAMA